MKKALPPGLKLAIIVRFLASGDKYPSLYYKFLWVDISAYGSVSDAQIFYELKDCFEDGSIGFPETSPIPQHDEPVPYFIMGDDASGIRTFLMKPYGHMNLQRDERSNYRISRGRRVVENAFGILPQRWQVLLTTMQPMPSIALDIVECCVCLHNLMRIR
ncbi:uncharacterized protein LOC124133867 [Haliotis rufescens]|uniref:uncharacterized protein LOC124133867 n=1 Tax=Haliotis rufescens TaxID=6454 RepID=UPI00201EDC1F|nr:uncharacterized protein LOC124133867 [Haliotis rufescens]